MTDNPLAELSIPEVPKVPEEYATPDSVVPPPPIDKDSVRSLSSTRRPLPPPKENRRSRPSMLHISASQPELVSHSNGIFKRRPGRRHIISQLASLKHWFVESAKRAKSPHPKTPKSNSGQSLKFRLDKSSPEKGQDSSKQAGVTSGTADLTGSPTPRQVKRSSNASSLAPSSASYAHHRNSYPRQPRAASSSHRNSLSPSPLTPRSSYRRSSVGLRGRKSTSSSISSVRSIHHAHSHSKASSVSSNSLDTVSTPIVSARNSRSPHTSVKVLPATPNATSRFPSNIRLVRNPSGFPRDTGEANGHGIYSVFNETAPAPLMSSPSGFVYARRKRSAFKGPMLHTANLMASNELGTPGLPSEGQAADGAGGSERARPGTRKSQIIEEEEDDSQDEDIEEVDTFSNQDEADVSFDENGGTDLDNEARESDVHSQAPAPEIVDNDTTATNHKPGLFPAPDLRDSGVHPPRSSSLNLPDLQDDPHSNAAEREDGSANEPTEPVSPPRGDSAAIKEQSTETATEERPLTATKDEAPSADAI